MYAVIQTGGKQYVVAPKEAVKEAGFAKYRLSVEKLDATPGDQVTFPVLLYKNEDQAVQINPANIVVKATVIEQTRGEKITIIKSKRRKHHRKQMGHRQYHSVVEINSIGE